MIKDLGGDKINQLADYRRDRYGELNNLEGEVDIKKFLKELEQDIKKTEEEVIKHESLERLEDIFRTYSGQDRIISSFDVLEGMKQKPPIEKIMTGIKPFDNILDGFTKKQLVVIAAATKSGKTSFCIELTIRLKDKKPLWLSFEEPVEDIIQKFLDRKEEPPLFYTPEVMTGNTLLWVEKKIIEAKAKYDCQVVFIDHLHFIVPFSNERQDLMIGHTMRELKKMAKMWNVVIFIISHLKKTKMVEQPDLEDLRDSSFTAQEADTVVMLWRKTERKSGEVVITNEVNVSVQANRRTGKTGNVKMMYDNGRFLEIDNSKYSELENDALENWDKN